MDEEILRHFMSDHASGGSIEETARALVMWRDMTGKQISGPHVFIESQEVTVRKPDKFSIVAYEDGEIVSRNVAYEDGEIVSRNVELEDPNTKPYYVMDTHILGRTKGEFTWDFPVQITTDFKTYFVQSSPLFDRMMGGGTKLTTADVEFLREHLDIESLTE